MDTTADADGYFELTRIPGGTYTVLVTTVSYTAQKQNFIIEAGKPTTHKARLSADNQSKPYRCNCYRQTFRLNELSPLMTGVKANNGMAAFTLRGGSVETTISMAVSQL